MNMSRQNPVMYLLQASQRKRRPMISGLAHWFVIHSPRFMTNLQGMMMRYRSYKEHGMWLNMVIHRFPLGTGYQLLKLRRKPVLATSWLVRMRWSGPMEYWKYNKQVQPGHGLVALVSQHCVGRVFCV